MHGRGFSILAVLLSLSGGTGAYSAHAAETPGDAATSAAILAIESLPRVNAMTPPSFCLQEKIPASTKPAEPLYLEGTSNREKTGRWVQLKRILATIDETESKSGALAAWNLCIQILKKDAGAYAETEGNAAKEPIEYPIWRRMRELVRKYPAIEDRTDSRADVQAVLSDFKFRIDEGKTLSPKEKREFEMLLNEILPSRAGVELAKLLGRYYYSVERNPLLAYTMLRKARDFSDGFDFQAKAWLAFCSKKLDRRDEYQQLMTELKKEPGARERGPNRTLTFLEASDWGMEASKRSKSNERYDVELSRATHQIDHNGLRYEVREEIILPEEAHKDAIGRSPGQSRLVFVVREAASGTVLRALPFLRTDFGGNFAELEPQPLASLEKTDKGITFVLPKDYNSNADQKYTFSFSGDIETANDFASEFRKLRSMPINKIEFKNRVTVIEAVHRHWSSGAFDSEDGRYALELANSILEDSQNRNSMEPAAEFLGNLGVIELPLELLPALFDATAYVRSFENVYPKLLGSLFMSIHSDKGPRVIFDQGLGNKIKEARSGNDLDKKRVAALLELCFYFASPKEFAGNKAVIDRDLRESPDEGMRRALTHELEIASRGDKDDKVMRHFIGVLASVGLNDLDSETRQNALYAAGRLIARMGPAARDLPEAKTVASNLASAMKKFRESDGWAKPENKDDRSKAKMQNAHIQIREALKRLDPTPEVLEELKHAADKQWSGDGDLEEVLMGLDLKF